MKKEIRRVVGEILQVTTVDERWYVRETFDDQTGLPSGHDFVPSVTWITSKYPMGVGFYRWLAGMGWDEAERVRAAAGGKGSKVHQAITDLIDGKTLALDAAYVNPHTGEPEELTVEEWKCLVEFRDWWAMAKPTTLLRDVVVWHDEAGYAGTLDWLGILTDQTTSAQSPPGLWLLDFKTSQEVWPSHELQVSAYKAALLSNLPGELGDVQGIEALHLGILQVGYRRNQRGWKLSEVEDQYDLFLAAKTIWAKETEGEAPFQAEYPLILSLPLDGQPTTEPTAVIPKRRGRPRKAPAEQLVRSDAGP